MVIGYVVSTGLLPVMRHLWLYAASGNANFFYALTIVYTAAHVAAAVDLLQAHGRRQHDLAKGLAVADPKDDVMLR
jgi:phosphatidylinositol glycan class U